MLGRTEASGWGGGAAGSGAVLTAGRADASGCGASVARGDAAAGAATGAGAGEAGEAGAGGAEWKAGLAGAAIGEAGGAGIDAADPASSMLAVASRADASTCARPRTPSEHNYSQFFRLLFCSSSTAEQKQFNAPDALEIVATN